MDGLSTEPMTPAGSSDLKRDKQQLLQEMKVTKGSRFNAAERLGRRDKRMIAVTAWASVYVILLTVVPLYFHPTEIITSFANAFTIALSLIILAASLLQYSNNDPVKAEQMHRCALEINALRREFRATEPVTSDVMLEFSKRFDEILQKYSVNHEPIDYERYQLEHPVEYPEVNKPQQRKGLEALLLADRNWPRWIVAGMTFVAVAISAAAAVMEFWAVHGVK